MYFYAKSAKSLYRNVVHILMETKLSAKYACLCNITFDVKLIQAHLICGVILLIYLVCVLIIFYLIFVLRRTYLCAVTILMKVQG